jgi:hypothetical protein
VTQESPKPEKSPSRGPKRELPEGYKARQKAVPVGKRPAWKRVLMGDSPASAAIRAFCQECLGYEENPIECTAVFCPLFMKRPGAAKAIRGR